MTESDSAKDFDDWLAGVHSDIVGSLEHHLDDLRDDVTATGQAANTKISVVIVEDHPMFRRGLRAQFDTDPAIEVVAEFETAAESVRGVLELRPSVVLMDLRLPWTPDGRPTYCGTQAITQILREWPDANIIVIATDDDERVREAVKAGARSYVSRDAEPRVLLQVVHLTARETHVPRPGPTEPTGLTFSELTARENMQLALAAGHTDRQIAEKLALSPKTVANNWANIKRKLEVSSRTEAVDVARAQGRPAEG